VSKTEATLTRMLIDLHTHTRPCSGCSGQTADELIQAAMRTSLDAICVTDHLYAWGGRDAQALARERYGFTVFRGVEARTTLGDVLVFGLDEDFEQGIDGPELLRHVHERGGASVLAHPFRHGGGWALWYWLNKHGLTVDASLALRPELEHIHAIETFNGQVNADELRQAEEVARILGLPTCGGSDAHATSQVGCTATEFARTVTTEAELAREIREGRIRPRRLR
jgi:predicted metal-dependent phosphoesterase TrpH